MRGQMVHSISSAMAPDVKKGLIIRNRNTIYGLVVEI